MDIRAFFLQKSLNSEHATTESRTSSTDQEGAGNDEPCCSQQVPSDEEQDKELEPPPQKKRKSLLASEKKKIYKAKLSYKKEWETKYPWIICKDPNEGMFCGICKKWGSPGSRGAWSTRGITDWNHASELLKQHAESQWHRNAAVTAGMAQQVESSKSVLELQCSAAAKEALEKRQRNRDILLKLMRSVYFLAKNRIPHTTVYSHLIDLLVANGDKLLEQHMTMQAANARYTSTFSATMIIEAIDLWLDRKLTRSLQSSPYFSILADECEDISTQEELSLCFRWLVNGLPEEHFLTILHVTATDAKSITDVLTSFMSQKNLDYRKLVGQGYDGAATFSGIHSGVQKRIRAHAAHALYIHCACHRLQLASIQAGGSVLVIKKMFGSMTNLWKFFHFSPKRAEALKAVQAVLCLPELKVVKPSDTRWLSHERCIRAIRKELPALIITLQELYEESGDAEAYGLALVFSSFSGVASVILLSEVLDLLAKLNCFMQRKATDFSRLPIILDSIQAELLCLKEEQAEWCSEVDSTVRKLESEHGITITYRSSRSGMGSTRTVSEFRSGVATPYIDALVDNIKRRFSDEAIKVLVSASIFNPASLPTDPSALPAYGRTQIQALAEFYGQEATVVFNDTTYTSPSLIDGDELVTEWRLFKRALLQEKVAIMEKSSLSRQPTMQEVKTNMESSEAYTGIFVQTFKLLNIILALPVGTATVERSFSQMKMIKTRLRNRLSDCNLARLMRIAIEGPELPAVDFTEILEVFKEKNHRILL